MNPLRKTYMVDQIFNTKINDSQQKKKKKNYLNDNMIIYMVNDIIKKQNIQLLKLISDKKKIPFNNLKDEFHIVPYYTPNIVIR